MADEDGQQYAGAEDASEEAQRTPARAEVSQKLKLAAFSYAEVLDATKHQDDKIGQLLTSVAFLTAATIALAALEPTQLLGGSFIVPPFRLPLGLIALTVFLLGIAYSVMLLLINLSTPLRLPGLGGSRTERSKGRGMDWAGHVEASQIYFFEIAGLSVDEWERKWDATASVLERERLASLIKETHNLSLRTSAKYDRTTEAVSLLSVSLLAFALSVVFVGFLALGSRGKYAVSLTLWQRAIVAAIFLSYSFVQLLTRVRYDRQSVGEVPHPTDSRQEHRKYGGQLTYAFALPLLLGDELLYAGAQPLRVVWAASMIVLALVSLVAFWMAASESDSKLTKAVTRRRCTVAVLTIVLAPAAIVTALKGWYGWQLAIASFVVLFLVGISVLAPTMRVRADRKKYWSRLAKEEAAEPAAADPAESAGSPLAQPQVETP